MINKFKLKSEFSRNILSLVSGNTLSQIIAILMIPILTKIYSPVDFGKLAIVTAISNIAGVTLALRYEMAIMFPKKDEIAFFVLIKVIILSVFFSIAELLILYIFFKFTLNLYNNFLYIIVLISFSNIIFQASILWFNRNKSYYISSVIIVLKVSLISILQVLLQNVANGLILGYLYGSIILLSILLVIFLKNLIKYKIQFSKYKLFYLLKRYKKFPIYSLPASFLNSLGGNIPFMLIEAFFGTAATGIYSMAYRLIYAPVVLIAGSVNNVVYQKFSNDFVCKKYIYCNMKKLTFAMYLVGIFVVIITFIITKLNLIILILGDNWLEVNNIIIYFLPLMLFSMVSTSISRFAIFEKQEIGLYFQIFLLISTILSIVISSFFTNDFTITIFVFSITLSLVYIVQLNISLHLAKNHDKGIK